MQKEKRKKTREGRGAQTVSKTVLRGRDSGRVRREWVREQITQSICFGGRRSAALPAVLLR